MRFLLPISLALCAVATPATAQETEQSSAENTTMLQSRADDVVAWLEGETGASEIFAPSFLAQVPEPQLNAINAQLQAQYGAIQSLDSVTPNGAYNGQIVLRFEKALGSGLIAIDPQAPNQISTLLLRSFEPVGEDSVEKLSADLQALPGSTSAYFGPVDGTNPVFAHNTQQHFAIGSTFKLYVLSALAQSIAAGERDWSDVVPLSVKSFPSGRMQDWPQGAPATLQTYATMMISISDNTATDQLIATLGREAIEAEVTRVGHTAPSKTFPFMTTREMFLMKGGDKDRLARFAAASDSEQAEILASIKDSDATEEDLMRTFTGGPTAIDVEWLANMDDLRGLLSMLSSYEDDTARKVMAIHTSMSEDQREKWAYVGYKGGSEPGVLNLTWLLQDKEQQWHMLSLSWNNPEQALDDGALQLISQRILALPR